MIQEVFNTPFINLDVEVDAERLLAEYKKVDELYGFQNYRTNYWAVRRKYAKSWSGICLISSDGGLYSDMYEGYQSRTKRTPLTNVCPYMYNLIESIGGEAFNDRARILRIAPKESLVWHNHTFEHGQPATKLTVQIPIIVPDGFEYCVVRNTDFRWYKRFSSSSAFKRKATKHPKPGEAFVFNSFHYHNVFNPSDEHRVTLMFYVDYETPHVKKLVDQSIKRQKLV
jgi:hypothetical protein